VELSFLHRIELIAPRLGGQAPPMIEPPSSGVHNDLTRISLVIALTAGTIYHSAVLVTLAAVLT
jgi:hypothetical protein